MKVGVIGCGFIEPVLAKTIEDWDEIDLVIMYDRSFDVARECVSGHDKMEMVEDPEDLIRGSDIVVEAASQGAVAEFGGKVLASGKDLIIMSVGALVDGELYHRLKAAAKGSGARIYIPSGAIAGIDGVCSAAVSGITSISLTTRKPPQGFKGSKVVADRGININEVKDEVILFEGPATEAVSMFPKNINVAAIISLAGTGFKETSVRVIMDPKTSRNTHVVECEGRFGKFRIELENVPSFTNPRTSYLASISAIATLRKVVTGVWIGV